jgi:hypothetical protein
MMLTRIGRIEMADLAYVLLLVGGFAACVGVLRAVAPRRLR